MLSSLDIRCSIIISNEALPQTNESWLLLKGVGRAPQVPVW
jgi:hypothetical protein